MTTVPHQPAGRTRTLAPVSMAKHPGSARTEPAGDGDRRSHRNLILGICCLSLLIVGMDTTIVNVALPSISKQFGASISGLQWILDAYTVTLASLLMLSGSVADRWGRRRVLQTGLSLFSVASLLCSMAPNLPALVGFRALQAVGGSMMNPVALSIITHAFPGKQERAKAIGIWGSVVGFSLGMGPVLGGLLTETVGWRSIFWINVPIGAAAIVLCAVFVPESRSDRPRRTDPVGQLLVILALGGITWAIIESPRAGWGSVETLLALGLGILAAVVLVPYENRRRQPLINPRFFTSAPFAGATGIAVLAFGAFGAFLFYNTLYLQQVRELSALRAGLLTLPLAVATMALAPVSGRLVARSGARPPLAVAAILMLVAGVGLTRMAADTPITLLLVWYLIFGAGYGLVNAPITNTAVSGMPANQSGVAAAVASTSRQIGAALGVAISGAIVSATGRDRTGLVRAAAPIWWLIAAAGLGIGVLGVFTTSDWAGRTAERAARRVAEAEADGQAPGRGDGPGGPGGDSPADSLAATPVDRPAQVSAAN